MFYFWYSEDLFEWWIVRMLAQVKETVLVTVNRNLQVVVRTMFHVEDSARPGDA